ncbi:MAG TPA: RCC1 domain-containing protein, partial [Polyangiaceae bacterium]
MPARLSRSRRSFAFASAFATVVVLAGCQAILGIDPDARHDAVNDLADSSFSDAPALDSSGGNEGGVVLDTGTGACVSSECPTAGLGPCEENVCGDAGVCEIVSRDGQKCGADGTCRGYACIGSTSEIASAGDTTCVTTVDGVVWCWGADPSGILGDQGSTPRSTPYVVPLIAEGGSAGAKHVSLGHAHGCAVLTNNDLVCWGSDEFGQASGTEDAGAAVLPPTQFSVSSGAS